MSISQMFLPEYDQEMANTRKLLACLPEDKLDYQPHEKSMKLGRLAGHVAEMPAWIGMLPGSDKLEVPSDWKPNAATSTEQLLAFFDDNVAKGRAALAAMSDEEFAQNWSLIFKGHTAFTMPKRARKKTRIGSSKVTPRPRMTVLKRSVYSPISISGLNCLE